MTIPRLELRAALLASRLFQHIADGIGVSIENCHAWSDSRIVLHWLRSQGPTGNSVVDDYVAHIQELSRGVTWHHVPTGDNPADIASRGSRAQDLVTSQLWIMGPDWHRQPESAWPARQPNEDPDPPRADIRCLVNIQSTREDPVMIKKFSNLMRLLRALTRARRWIRSRREPRPPSPLTPVNAEDKRIEFRTCIKLSQRAYYAREIDQLQRGVQLLSNSSLLQLKPFLDKNDCLRVG
ncbi:unnamed protein product, partial [Trichogramma brassicae]